MNNKEEIIKLIFEYMKEYTNFKTKQNIKKEIKILIHSCGHMYKHYGYLDTTNKMAYNYIKIGHFYITAQRCTIKNKYKRTQVLYNTTLWRFLELEVDIITLEKLLFKFI